MTNGCKWTCRCLAGLSLAGVVATAEAASTTPPATWPQLPPTRTSMDWRRIGSLNHLPAYEIAASAAIIPGWEGNGVIVFQNAPKVSIDFHPGSPGIHALEVAYLTGGAYVPFTVVINGQEVGKSAPPAGAGVAVQVTTFTTPMIWGCANTLEFIPARSGDLGLFYWDYHPTLFAPSPAASWRQAVVRTSHAAAANLPDAETADAVGYPEQDATGHALDWQPARPGPVAGQVTGVGGPVQWFAIHLHQPLTFSALYLRLSANAPCSLLVNGKEFLKTADGKPVENPLGGLRNGGVTRLLVRLEGGADAWFTVETTPLGGSRLLALVPAALDPRLHRDDWPRAEIANGLVQATVALPDPEKGFHRGPRFEAAGMVTSLTVGGHQYISGNFSGTQDPVAMDQVAGTAEEFWEPLGFDEAAVGGNFIKIGVGLLERPYNKFYFFGTPYWITERFPWQVTATGDRVEFRQVVKDKLGWSYDYVKRVILVPGKAEMRLEHELTNTGGKRITSTHYNHHFLLVDHLPPGPDYTITYGFQPGLVNANASQKLDVNGAVIKLKGPDTVHSPLRGCVKSADNWVKIAHTPSGAGIRIAESAAPFRQALFVCANGICPESFTRIDLGPGETATWSRQYEFK